jgi:hypothetical protein
MRVTFSLLESIYFWSLKEYLWNMGDWAFISILFYESWRALKFDAAFTVTISLNALTGYKGKYTFINASKGTVFHVIYDLIGSRSLFTRGGK